MLDPIKFGIVCPGMKDDGQLDTKGIPADIVTAYLGRHGIVPSRTTDHMVLFLFSVGVTKGKWGTLLNTLLDFKADYDRNAPLSEVLPSVYAASPQRYAGKGLKDLGDEMWAHLRKSKQGHWQAQAYATLPTPKMTPRRAFQRLMAGDAEKVPLGEMADRVVAVGVIPYPPGIPIVMPGESIGPADGPWLTYLRTLQEYGHLFPGFAKEVEGAEELDGGYHIYCVKGGRRVGRGELLMIEYAAKTPTIPIPFHKLLKVVALVDGANPQVRALLERIAAENFEVEISDRYDRDVSEDAEVGAYIAAVDGERRDSARKLAQAVRDVGFRTPLWALADSSRIADTSVLGMTGEVDGYIYLGQQTPAFYAKQVIASITAYGMSLLPPFFGGLMGYDAEAKVSFACPGHQGGEFYRKSPAGQLFFKHFGEHIFRNDLCNADVELGDLLIHVGPAVDAQRHAAQVFGADRTYFVLNGTSTSNKIVAQAVAASRRPGALRSQQSQVTAPGRAGQVRWDSDLPADRAESVRHDRRGRLGCMGREVSARADPRQSTGQVPRASTRRSARSGWPAFSSRPTTARSTTSVR